jgi:predicted SAM-dependent methyltransferase
MQRLLTTGIKQSLFNLGIEIRTWLYHQKGAFQAKRLPLSALDKLHLGCGPNIKHGWLNIDLYQRADLKLDLREDLPFPDNSFSIIYNEHFFEHVDYPVPATDFLKECLRVLKPGGVTRIGVPDTEWPLQEYCDVRNDDYFGIARQSWHPAWCTTPMEHINYHFRQDGEHRFAYDFTTLEKVLLLSGFVNVTRVDFDPAIDSESRKTGTLYVTALKPG